ncbi:MAG: type II toxin-antitoxin system RelE/ParE family toxin [Nanoarchaeota archaeon]
MSYSIEWEGNSLNELNSLPLDLARRIWLKVESIKENPFHYLEKLKGMPEFKLRVGDYRAIFLVDNTNKILKVQAVGHRKNIYKKYKTD